MKKKLRIIACLLCTCMAHAGEIVAWKVPLQRYSWQHSGPEDQIRLPKPPEASPFFHTGDELWDLTKLPKDECVKTDPPLEWAVWNATTSTLVTKTEWNGIWQMRNQFDIEHLPRMCRATLEVFAVPQDGSPLADKSVLLSKLSWVSRSGQKVETTTKSDGSSIQMASTSFLSEDDSTYTGLQIQARIQAREIPYLEINNELNTRAGQPLWIARDFDGRQGIDLRLTTQVVLAEGSPYEDAMRLQTGSESKSLMTKRREPSRHRVHDNHWIKLMAFSLAELADMDSPEGEGSNVDPFADPPQAPAPVRIKYPQVDVPKELRNWVGGRAFDLRDFLKNAGLVLNQDDFAGFDPISGTIFFYSDSETEMDKFEQLFMPSCILTPKLLKLTLDGPGQSMLMARSGQKAALTRKIADDKVTRLIEIEPTIGENDDIIDLRLNYENHGESVLKHNTATTLQVDRSQNLLLGNDDKPMLRARAEIIRP